MKSTGDVTIPKLNAMAYEQVEIAGTPFSTYISNKTASGEAAQHSFTLRGYVRTWQNKNAEEFNRISVARSGFWSELTGPALVSAIETLYL